jgi:hypothetical protein
VDEAEFADRSLRKNKWIDVGVAHRAIKAVERNAQGSQISTM